MSLQHWFMAVGLDPPHVDNTRSRKLFEHSTDQKSCTSSPPKKKRKSHTWAIKAIIEKSDEFVGRTVVFRILKQMMTSKSQGVVQRGKHYQVEIRLGSPKSRVNKMFASKKDAILQYSTWLSQLELDDCDTGVSQYRESWRVSQVLDGIKNFTAFSTKQQALKFRKKWVSEQYLKLKSDYEKRVASLLLESQPNK